MTWSDFALYISLIIFIVVLLLVGANAFIIGAVSYGVSLVFLAAMTVFLMTSLAKD